MLTRQVTNKGNIMRNRNPYRSYSINPLEQPDIVDHDREFEEWLNERGYDADQILDIWEDLNKLDFYAEEFFEVMADRWDDSVGEAAYEAAEYDRKHGGY